MTCPICNDPSRSLSQSAAHAAQQIASADNETVGLNYRDWWQDGRQKFAAWKGMEAPCLCQPTQPTQVQLAGQLREEGRAIRIGRERFHPDVQARIDREHDEKVARYRQAEQAQKAERIRQYQAQRAEEERQEQARMAEEERQEQARRAEEERQYQAREAEENRAEAQRAAEREAQFNEPNRRYAEDIYNRLEQATGDNEDVRRANVRLTELFPPGSIIEVEGEEEHYRSGVYRWMDHHNDGRRQFLRDVIERQERDERLRQVLDAASRPLGLSLRGNNSQEVDQARVQAIQERIIRNEQELHEMMARNLGLRGPHMDNFFGCAEDVQAAARGRLGDLSIRLATSMIVTYGRLPVPVMQTEILGNSLLSVRDALSSTRCRALLQQIGVRDEPEADEEEFGL